MYVRNVNVSQLFFEGILCVITFLFFSLFLYFRAVQLQIRRLMDLTQLAEITLMKIINN